MGMHLFPEYDGVLSHKICLGYKSLLKVVLTSCLVSKTIVQVSSFQICIWFCNATFNF